MPPDAPPAPPTPAEPPLCEWCGDQLACEGYRYCTDCLESGETDEP